MKKENKDFTKRYEDQKKEIGKRISNLRAKKHISQEELAQKIICAQNTISKIESGKNALTLENLIKLSDFFNVSYDYICDGTHTSTVLDTLTKYIKIDYVSTKDFHAVYPVLKINSALINYLIMANAANTLFPRNDMKNSLINEERDTFYKMIKEDDGTLNDLVIPLTKEVIFPDEYLKEWTKVINIISTHPENN